MRIGIAAGALAVLLAVAGCGGSQNSNLTTIGGQPQISGDEWPARTTRPLDAATVEEVVAAPDGAHVRLSAYLVAVKLPCPLCNVGTTRPPREDFAGRTSRPRGPAPPGCLPCPDPAATIGDDAPGAAASPRPHLRAVGVAGALQPRHVGHLFVFVGVFHRSGADGPELEVTDVAALDGP